MARLATGTIGLLHRIDELREQLTHALELLLNKDQELDRTRDRLDRALDLLRQTRELLRDHWLTRPERDSAA